MLLAQLTGFQLDLYALQEVSFEVTSFVFLDVTVALFFVVSHRIL